jgi:sucrose-6-phosphate hydrolase SacC (GH32 family)
MFFSGSAVVDEKNTSGFGKPGNPAMVAVYTSLYPAGQDLARTGQCSQQHAGAVDRVQRRPRPHWTQYAGNPVIPLPPAPYADQFHDFRDPKVFWYEPGKKWVMVAVLSALHKAVLFSSKDLKNWSFMSEFGPANAVGGVWECPDLFELPARANHSSKKKWVLTINLNPGARRRRVGRAILRRTVPTARAFAAEDVDRQGTAVGQVFQNFEGSGSYASVDWTATGDFAGQSPSSGNLPGQGGVAVSRAHAWPILSSTAMPAPARLPRRLHRIAARSSNCWWAAGTIRTTRMPATVPCRPARCRSRAPISKCLRRDLRAARLGRDRGPGGRKVGAWRDRRSAGRFRLSGPGLVNTFFGSELNDPATLRRGRDVADLHDREVVHQLPDRRRRASLSSPNPTAVVLKVNGVGGAHRDGPEQRGIELGELERLGPGRPAGSDRRHRRQHGRLGPHQRRPVHGVGPRPRSRSRARPAVNLLVGGKVVRSATGQNSETLAWKSWNVAEFAGQQAQIQVADHNTGGWGHVLADDVVFSDQAKEEAHWVDQGSDFYAAVTWNGVPDGRRIAIGWMSNWNYAGGTPTSPWRNAQTLPREWTLRTIDGSAIDPGTRRRDRAACAAARSTRRPIARSRRALRR